MPKKQLNSNNLVFSIEVSSPREGKMIYIGSDWRDISWKSEDGTVQQSTIRTDYEITERTIDWYGQFLFPADQEINTWWTNTGLSDDIEK